MSALRADLPVVPHATASHDGMGPADLRKAYSLASAAVVAVPLSGAAAAGGTGEVLGGDHRESRERDELPHDVHAPRTSS
jgi:hypothetical protein